MGPGEDRGTVVETVEAAVDRGRDQDQVVPVGVIAELIWRAAVPEPAGGIGGVFVGFQLETVLTEEIDTFVVAVFLILGFEGDLDQAASLVAVVGLLLSLPAGSISAR